MASSDVGELITLVEISFEACLLVAGLVALSFVIAAHRERRKKRAAAMSAKAREPGLAFSGSANPGLARTAPAVELAWRGHRLSSSCSTAYDTAITAKDLVEGPVPRILAMTGEQSPVTCPS